LEKPVKFVFEELEIIQGLWDREGGKKGSFSDIPFNSAQEMNYNTKARVGWALVGPQLAAMIPTQLRC
jgi:hypothetical protein